MKLGTVGLDPQQIYQVREAALDRSAIHISLEDGTIGFTQDVMGRITGAFFEGEGEILLTPPTEVERKSMSLFTGMAILEERFATAYFRFDDDAAAELRPDLRAIADKQPFIDRYGLTMKNLAGADAMRLLTTFSQLLPDTIASDPDAAIPTKPATKFPDRFLHARLQGTKLGIFDVYFDSAGTEQILAGQGKTLENGETYYDVWTSFSPSQGKSTSTLVGATADPQTEQTPSNKLRVRNYRIKTNVLPPKQIHSDATLQCEVRDGGERVLVLELSRFLQIESATLDGKPVEYIHNPALEGTQLSRQGNDLVAVIFPHAMTAGQTFELEFVYGGEVLAEAGGGLLYVGARGTWYPNRGLEMANFDLEFSYPPGWTLVATGKPSAISSDSSTNPGDQRSHWISDRPIPLAGFNLGKYREAITKVGNVTVETYATQTVEKGFPEAQIQVIPPNHPELIPHPPEIVLPSRPSPAQQEVFVGESAGAAISFFSDRFGAFPYSHLALTQMPGRESQGWPGLVFLSSYAFLNDQQREQLHFEPYEILIQHLVPAHEVAHQWWGDLITWRSYRDQWFSEGLANYCALMMLQEQNPAGFRQIMEAYRNALVQKDKDGMTPMEAGPVTLGTRLLSSKSPEGYEAISYGRGTWLFYMLRSMLKDAAEQERNGKPSAPADDPFVTALKKVRLRYEGKSISTRELLDVFAEDLPKPLRFESKKSLDWFLEGWINGTSLPKLELRSVKFAPKGAGSVVSGIILQKDAPEGLVTSVPVYAVVTGRQPVFLGRVFADGEESTFHLSAPAGLRKIVLDPYDTLLTRPK